MMMLILPTSIDLYNSTVIFSGAEIDSTENTINFDINEITHIKKLYVD